MKRPALALLFFLLVGGPLQAIADDARSRPNIVFILSDDHATSAIGAYGSLFAETPNLDRLAKQGMRFTNCFATNSICTPSRASILTGRYAHTTGVTTNYRKLDQKRFVTYPRLLHDAGYQTALVGKSLQWRRPHGFDFWCTTAGAEYTNPPMNLNGKTSRQPGYVGEVISRQCLKWLDDRDTSRPFLLVCQPSAPHAPFVPNPKDASLYADQQVAEPATFDDDYAGRPGAGSIVKSRIDPGLLKAIRHWGHAVPEDLEGDALKRWAYQWYIKNYMRCVKSIDDTVGVLLDYLDRHDLTNNTIVIYASDQGMFLGEHGWFDKRAMYEESIRMPLLVRCPDTVRGGSTQSAIVLNVDLAPTLLELGNVPVPEAMRGRSVLPLLRGDTPDGWRRTMYYHYYEYDPEFAWADVRPHYGVRTETHKLIWFYTIDGWELYDLSNDPREMKNVYHDADYSDVVKRLTRELISQRKQLGDRTGPPVPRFSN